MNKTTVVIGASANPERYSNKATLSLKKHGHKVIPVGIKVGEIDGMTILTGTPDLTGIHTVTLYVSPKNQPMWYEYILKLNPERIIFNPGTENPDFYTRASEKKIECIEACTLVMLSIGNY